MARGRRGEKVARRTRVAQAAAQEALQVAEEQTPGGVETATEREVAREVVVPGRNQLSPVAVMSTPNPRASGGSNLRSRWAEKRAAGGYGHQNRTIQITNI